jgi:hypothetical protein
LARKKEVLAVGAFDVSARTAAALWDDLVDLLIDALVNLRFLSGSLIGGESASRDGLIDTRMRGVLECRRHLGRGLAVGFGDVGQ